MMNLRLSAKMVVCLFTIVTAGCSAKDGEEEGLTASKQGAVTAVANTDVGLRQCGLNQQKISTNLETFHDLDLNRFNHQDVDNFSLSHADDVLVHWPDGRTTNTLADHKNDVRWFFLWAPDVQITSHKIAFGGGDTGQFTGVVGTFHGHFTAPMPLCGTVFQPTGNAFTLDFATIGVWNTSGKMSEEYLLWDNKEFFRQIGVDTSACPPQ